MLHIKRLVFGTTVMVAGLLAWGGNETTAQAARHYTTTPTSLRGNWISPQGNGQIKQIIVAKYAVLEAMHNSKGKVVSYWQYSGKQFLSKHSKKTALYVSKQTKTGFWKLGSRKYSRNRVTLKRGEAVLGFKNLVMPTSDSQTLANVYFGVQDLPALQAKLQAMQQAQQTAGQATGQNN